MLSVIDAKLINIILTPDNVDILLRYRFVVFLPENKIEYLTEFQNRE